MWNVERRTSAPIHPWESTENRLNATPLMVSSYLNITLYVLFLPPTTYDTLYILFSYSFYHVPLAHVRVLYVRAHAKRVHQEWRSKPFQKSAYHKHLSRIRASYGFSIQRWHNRVRFLAFIRDFILDCIVGNCRIPIVVIRIFFMWILLLVGLTRKILYISGNVKCDVCYVICYSI